MSRAFVSNNDGWLFCIEWGEDCAYADETGKCALKVCSVHPEKNPDPKERHGHEDAHHA
jgi:hypothetical protein